MKVDYKKKRIEFQDQNKKLIYFLRFIFALNILNAVIFYLIFNHQDDGLKWVWLFFAILNVIALYLLFSKVSLKNKISFTEIKYANTKPLLGLYIKQKDNKYRITYISEKSDNVKKFIDNTEKLWE